MNKKHVRNHFAHGIAVRLSDRIKPPEGLLEEPSWIAEKGKELARQKRISLHHEAKIRAIEEGWFDG